MLFAVPADGTSSFDDAAVAEIRSTVRSQLSPRHTPDVVVAVPSIPTTLSGKKLELPVKKLLANPAAEGVVNRSVLRDAGSVDALLAAARAAGVVWHHPEKVAGSRPATRQAGGMGGDDRSRTPFVLLEGATFLSAAGNGAAEVVLPWLVLERTGSAGSAGLLAAATAVPLLIASLFSGTVVDMLGRRRTSVGSDILSFAAVAAIPILDRYVGLNLGLLIALAVIGAAFDPSGITARETMLPAASARAGWSLDRVNGVHEAIWGAAYLLGPGLGGVLIAVGRRHHRAVGDGARVRPVGRDGRRSSGSTAPADPRPARTPTGSGPGTVEGLKFVWNDRLLRSLGLLTAVLVAAYLPIEGVLLPVHFEDLEQPGRLGAIVMAMSLGGMLGALAYGALAGRARRSLVLRVCTAVDRRVRAGAGVPPAVRGDARRVARHRDGVRTGPADHQPRHADPDARAAPRPGGRHHHVGRLRRRPARLPAGRRRHPAVGRRAGVPGRRRGRDARRGVGAGHPLVPTSSTISTPTPRRTPSS